MAYQIKRRNHYVEQLELVDESGKIVHTLNIDLDPGAVAEDLSRKYLDLVKAKEETDQLKLADSDDLLGTYEKLGDAAIAMIEAALGKENTKVILEFYSGRYNDLIIEVLPFLRDVVVPEVRRMAREQKKEILQKYNRKTRRFFKGVTE
nr:MAG TPA: hypothetical protein [Caudoviricetes sp.]